MSSALHQAHQKIKRATRALTEVLMVMMVGKYFLSNSNGTHVDSTYGALHNMAAQHCQFQNGKIYLA